ncbi:hypothetical protein EDE11_10757 [Methylomonas methanica]|uniref:STAS/SEC14 domain-containing protein n=2 Tax=Methylomonas TaxID=416 RepID=A0A126T664_9GAMM|nr:hypothetical protein JT25_013880 [Methylomonas denitrificans]OAI05138.1 hypothetical protein A1342_12045 [Methylomonas methanica]TCV84399.1 hypothetical protein EDE11_10757 [Methylomonas methanica]
MPYTVEWDGAGLIKNLTGFVSASEFAKSAAATTSHFEFDRAKYVINDFTEVTGADLMSALEDVAVMRLGASRNTRPRLKVAYVGNDDTIKDFVTSLLSSDLNCGWDTKVFATREAAMLWVAKG